MREDAPILALDVGTRKIGLAQSLPLRIGARPIGVFGTSEIWDVLKRSLSVTPSVETIVVGWPLREDGTASPLCAVVEAFELELHARWPHLEIVRVDERYSSAEARDRVNSRTGSKRRNMSRLDDEAACILLEDFLRGDTGDP